ncbi:MAG: heparan-alpha-glucosaminide N-acetyltransferase domain-containing protein [Rickettsiales bacterium]|nr:heparan-alpha-glucosaminide N-acetyltransferase domain-containing protein [Rickettsiales bacterium]
MTHTSTSRYDSLDLLKGLVMVLMTIDHARYFLYVNEGFTDPLQIDLLSTHEFFLRWISHLCAPGFVLLAGMAIWVKVQRVDDLELFKSELFKRGLILVALEMTIINLVWKFELVPSVIYLQIIWAIGLSFVAMSMMLNLQAKYIGIIGLLIIFWHGFLYGLVAEAQIDLPLVGIMMPYHYPLGLNSAAITLYPLLPWLGIMMAGYYLASITLKCEPGKRMKLYGMLGVASIILFAMLRYVGVADWNPYTCNPMICDPLSFINLSKYPPSLGYMLLMLSILLLLLAFFERYLHFELLRVLGRRPFLFYLIHLYALRMSAELLKAFGVGVSANGDWVGLSIWAIYGAAISTVGACYLIFKRKPS